jgi:hypothetical protein
MGHTKLEMTAGYLAPAKGKAAQEKLNVVFRTVGSAALTPPQVSPSSFSPFTLQINIATDRTMSESIWYESEGELHPNFVGEIELSRLRPI